MSTVRPHANAAPAPVLEVTGLDVHYGRRRARRRALHDVTLTVAPGETLGVIGETGSGKSTLARTVLGLVRASAGSVVVGGEDVTGHGPRQWRALRRRGVVQYVFQDPLRSLDPDLTVEDSLTEPLLVQGVTRAEAARRARALLARVRLPEDLLGQAARGAVRRAAPAGRRRPRPHHAAAAADPRQAASALDSANRVQILDILKELRADGVALVLISHDLGSVAGVADRVAVLYQGRLVETGPAAEVVGRPRHVYTRLLVSSAPTLRTGAADRSEREALRALLSA